MFEAVHLFEVDISLKWCTPLHPTLTQTLSHFFNWELTLWEVDLVGVDLVGVDFVGIDFVGVDFVGVDLVGMNRPVTMCVYTEIPKIP